MYDQNQVNDDNLSSQDTGSQMPVGGLGNPPSDDHSEPAANDGSLNVQHPPEPSDSSAILDSLTDIKNQAISQLTPLVKHLDQSPEERFKTTLMMIQASDNQELIKDAYEAAEQITDEKAKAQALLDIVNEINYFTSRSS
jgi:hypothetical protein